MFTTLSRNAPWAGRRRRPRRPSTRWPSLEALEDRCLLSLDALVVRAAPSGPDKTTSVADWTDVPDLDGHITTAAGSDLEITVAGEAETTAAKRMFIRALVDGQPAGPSDVVFADGGYTGTHSFTFAKTGLGAGAHVVNVEWLVDAGGTAFIGDRTLTLHASPEVTEAGGLVVKAAPSGPDKTTSVAGWTDVPDLGGHITTSAGSDLEITVAGEVETTAAKRMFIRALVDGQPADPSDVVFADGGYTGTHSFTFAKTGLGAGAHEVKVQWLVDAGGTASIGDRTLTLYASPEVTETGGLVVKAAPSGPDKTTSVADWTDVPDLGGLITTAPGCDLQITVAGEVETTAAKRMFIRALVDGQPADPSDVVFADGGYTGTHSFTFAKTGLGAGPHEVKVQWLVDAGGTAFIGDRTLTLHASPEVANWRQVNEDGFFGLSVGSTSAEATLFTFGDHLYLLNTTEELFMMNDPITRDWQDTGLQGSFTVIGDFLYREVGQDLFFIPEGASPLGTGWKQVTSQGLPGGGSPSPRTVFENQIYGVYDTPDGFQIYRSSDIGKVVMNWEIVATSSFGNPEENHQLAFLAVFGDRLCAGTNTLKMGLSFGDPAAYMSSGVEIWESPTGDLNSWKLVNNPGFGTKTQVEDNQGNLVTISTNQTIMSWTVYKAPGEQQAHLYVGTATHFAPGGQIWRYDGTGITGWQDVTPPWAPVPELSVDPYQGTLRMSAMVVYGDDLYLAEGFPSANLGKYDGKTWSIVVMGHEPFGTQNQGLFSLAVFQDRLYVNTFPKLDKGTQVWAYPFPN